MPGEIFGDIRCASDTTPVVGNNSNFAALVAQLRNRRLHVEENVVESSGGFNSLAADRVFTTAGSKKYRSYSSFPEPLSFIGIENTPPNVTRTPRISRKERAALKQQNTGEGVDKPALVSEKSSLPASPHKPSFTNPQEIITQPHTEPTTSGKQSSPASSEAHHSDQHLSPGPSEKTVSSDTGKDTSATAAATESFSRVIHHPLADDFPPEPSHDTNDTTLMVDIALVEQTTTASVSQQSEREGSTSTCETPLAYEWPIEGAQMLYTSPQHPSSKAPKNGRRSYPGSLADSQDSWKISATNANANALLTAPPPVTAAFEAAESFVNFATASITALSSSSQDFFDRSALSLKDAAVRSQTTWQQAISKVGQALLTAKTVIETPRLTRGEEPSETQVVEGGGEEEEEDQAPPLLSRAVSISATVRSGFSDAVQQAKEILRNI